MSNWRSNHYERKRSSRNVRNPESARSLLCR
nr:MAG TPA: hypothetical protein [Caudoviricetes sp.]